MSDTHITTNITITLGDGKTVDDVLKQLNNSHAACSATSRIKDLQDKLATIDALHRGETDTDPDSFTKGEVFCITDDEEWPCETHRILHPKEAK